MKTGICRRTLFVFFLVTITGSLPLLAQSNPTPSRFNVRLGAIRAPNAPSEIPVVSSGSWLTTPNASVTADGKEIFLSNDVGTGHDLYFASRASPSDPWGTPQLVGAPVNTPYAEFVPWISADGLILVWSDGWARILNHHPGGQGASDLWMSTRTDRGAAWSEPVNLGPQVNTADYELFPRLTADGLELFFTRVREGVSADVCVSRRWSRHTPWEQAAPLPDYINLPYGGNYMALPSPDGLTLLTGSWISSSQGIPMDIFVATRKDRNSPWNLPVSIGPAINNGPWNQAMPGMFHPDGSALYFVHDNGNGVIPDGCVLKLVDLLPILEVTVKYPSLFHPMSLESSRLVTGPWAPVMEPAELENGENRVVLPAKPGAEFFRLVRP